MIDASEVEKLAALARIKIEEEEKQELVKEIDSILSYVDEIKKASPGEDSAPQTGSVYNVFREDEARTTSAEDREALLKQAPQREGDFIAVKKIIEQD